MSVMAEPVSTPTWRFSVKWVRISRCQFRSRSSAPQRLQSAGRCPAPRAPGAGGPPRSGAEARSAPPPARRGDGLPVDDAALSKGHLHPEPVLDQAGQHLQLDLPHQLEVDLPQGLAPHHPELGVLLLQLAQVGEHGVGVTALGQQHLIGEHRLQLGRPGGGLRPQRVPRAGAAQAGDGAHRAGGGLVQRPVFRAGVDPELADLLLPAPLPAAGQGVPHPEGPAGDLQIGEPVVAVPGHLEHPGGKVRRIGASGHTAPTLQERVHPSSFNAEPK